MSNFDVIVVGGGIAGASLAAELVPNLRVLLVEAETQCGFHSTGRSAAFWLENYGGPPVAQLSLASRELLAPFLTPRGALHISRDPAKLPDLPNARSASRAEIEAKVPGIASHWAYGIFEDSCADIDVAALHARFLARVKRSGGEVRTGARLDSARRMGGRWSMRLVDGSEAWAGTVVNAAGAWADDVAVRCGVAPLGITPKRRTMVQLRVGMDGLKSMPLVMDASESFYFKGEGDRSIWLSPHDEIDTDPCDAAPEEIDVAVAIDRFQQVVDWPIEAVERKWAGLRTFSPDRLPVYGFDPAADGFFWCAGQGGFGIQTAPAAAKMAAALVLGGDPEPLVAHIDSSVFSPARFS